MDAQTLNHMPVLNLLAKINRREIKHSTLPPRARQNMVAHLMTQGCPVSDISQMLGVSVRTIVRDRQIIRGRNAVYSDESGFTPRIVGMMVEHLDDSLSRLRAIQFSSSATARDRVAAERGSAYVFATFVKRFQSLGYMPHFAVTDSPSAASAAQSKLHESKEQMSSEKEAAIRQRLKEMEEIARANEEQGTDTDIAGGMDVSRWFADDALPGESKSGELGGSSRLTRKQRRRWRKIERQMKAAC